MTATPEAIAIERACEKLVVELAEHLDDRFLLTTQGRRFAARRGRLLMHARAP